MSRLLAAALATLLMFALVPTAFAQEAPAEGPVDESAIESEETAEESDIVECENPDGLEVITREGLASAIATPFFATGAEEETKQFLVDLQATSTLATATVDTLMTWDIVANDIDLEVIGARTSGISENFQPLDPSEERVTLAKIAHCEVLTVAAIDYWVLVPLVEEPALTFTVSKFVEPVITGAPVVAAE